MIPAGQHSDVEQGQAPGLPQPGLIISLGIGGTLWDWGWNSSGQLGNGTTTDCHSPVNISGINGIIAVSGGYADCLALKPDGTVWVWGANNVGQLGNGTYTASNTPVQIPNLSGITAISAGYYHNMALKQDGTVWVWGDNSHGQLGNDTKTQSNIPIPVNGLTGVIGIAGGYYHSLALKSDGTVWAWGMNDRGQLGDGSTIERHIPVEVTGLTGITAVSASDWHSIGLKTDGTVWAWGSNSNGQLGNGTTVDSHNPVQVINLKGISAISAGGRNNLALAKDGTVWGWGLNDIGELGDGTTTGRSVPVQTKLPSGIIAVSIRDQHSMALSSDGKVWSWGWNGYGQIGTGTTANTYVPMQLNLSGIIAINAGVDYDLAISESPTITLFTPSVNGLTVSINGITLPATASASITGIDWDWGDGQKIKGWFPQTHTYSQTGTYTVSVITILMLIVGDFFAVAYYRRHAQWRTLIALLPWVLPGIVLGWLALGHLDDTQLKPALGVLILTLVVLQLIRTRSGEWMDKRLPHTWWFVAGVGLLAGFSTMLGNAAGAIMTVFFLAKGLPKNTFMGTAAWFFLIVNLIKVPFSANLGLANPQTMLFAAIMIPAITAGAVIGLKVLPRLPQKLFDRIVLAIAVLASLRLVIPWP